jgi:bifunctional DNase/RNase
MKNTRLKLQREVMARKNSYGRRLLVFFIVFGLWGMNSSCSLAKDSSAVRMKIHSLQASAGRAEIAVLLTDDAGKKFLPIAVGGDQALSIQLGRNGQAVKRPLTHDLMASIFKSLQVEVNRVTITDLREGVYYAEIRLRQNGREHKIDARPSDAIALSLRVNAPIYAMPHLLQPLADLKTGPGEESLESAVSIWGMKVQALTENLANFFGRSEGVLVADLEEPGSASESGIRVGDIVLRVNNQEIRDVGAFLKVTADKKDTNRVEIGVLRGDRNMKFVIRPE